MKYLFLLSGSYPDIAKFEIKTLLETYGIKYEIIEESYRILVLDTEINEKILERVVLTKNILEFIGKFNNINEISIDWKKFVEIPYYVDSIRIPRRNPNFRNITSKIADMIWFSLKNPKVDSKKFKTKIIVIIYNDKLYIGKFIFENSFKKYFERNPDKKSFFHPTSLKPEIARLMINLAKVKEKDTIYDPFCGTGTILIEACLMDIKAIGSDIQEIMVEGSKINLKKYCKTSKWKVFKFDAREIDKLNFKVDAIVTDPPYGRGSKIFGNTIEIYNKFIKKSYEILKNKGRVVLFIPHFIEKYVDFYKFKIINKFEIKVHSKLKRKLYVLEK